MRPLEPSELPTHAELQSVKSETTAPDLDAFITEVLHEANLFMTDYHAKAFSVKRENQLAAPATAKVTLFARDIPVDEIPTTARTPGASGIAETWFSRTSIHSNKREQGTADWDEFESGLLDNHSQNESEYAPDVYDAHKVLSWDESIGQIEGWRKVGMSIYEMAHKVPPPLNNRVFSVVVITARSSGDPSIFFVVQIPVDVSGVSKALYSNGRNKQDGDSAEKKKEVTMGQYVSIERCELVDGGANVKWQMGTASDAKGALPMWVQKMAVPGTVIKDVSYFIDWLQKRRQGK